MWTTSDEDIGSLLKCTKNKPIDKLLSFAGLRDNLDSNGFASPLLVASAKSNELASRISVCLLMSKSAMVWIALALSSGAKRCNTLLPVLAIKLEII